MLHGSHDVHQPLAAVVEQVDQLDASGQDQVAGLGGLVLPVDGLPSGVFQQDRALGHARKRRLGGVLEEGGALKVQDNGAFGAGNGMHGEPRKGGAWP